jgi:hypothetical protein
MSCAYAYGAVVVVEVEVLLTHHPLQLAALVVVVGLELV